jgi:hypothetical protein
VCFDTPNDKGVAIVDHPDSLAAFVADAGGSRCPAGVLYVPYADGQGTPAVLSTDFDDRAAIVTNMCESLHMYFSITDCQCANFNATFCSNPAAPPPQPNIMCDREP